MEEQGAELRAICQSFIRRELGRGMKFILSFIHSFVPLAVDHRTSAVSQDLSQVLFLSPRSEF